LGNAGLNLDKVQEQTLIGGTGESP